MILVRGPEILSNGLVNQKKHQRNFRKASVIPMCNNLDELIIGKNEKWEGSGIGENILSQMLTEMEEGSTSG